MLAISIAPVNERWLFPHLADMHYNGASIARFSQSANMFDCQFFPPPSDYHVEVTIQDPTPG